MKAKELNHKLFEFLQASPTPFHAVSFAAVILKKAGFEQLHEDEEWSLRHGGKYFFIREDGAMVAFTIGPEGSLGKGFRFVGCHTDSPALQVKPTAFGKDRTNLMPKSGWRFMAPPYSTPGLTAIFL